MTGLPAASMVTNVSGTLKGTFTSGGGDGPYRLTGKGPVSPLGHTTVKGSENASGPDYQMTGTLTLTTSKGNIVMGTVVVSPSTANLPATAGQITIHGSGFDPTAAYDTVTFNDGAVGSVTAATSTALTVACSPTPTPPAA